MQNSEKSKLGGNGGKEGATVTVAGGRELRYRGGSHDRSDPGTVTVES